MIDSKDEEEERRRGMQPLLGGARNDGGENKEAEGGRLNLKCVGVSLVLANPSV